jgi:hypothetical protein
MFFETHTLNNLMHISLVEPVRAFLDWEQVYMEKYTWKDAKDRKVLEDMQPMVSMKYA